MRNSLLFLKQALLGGSSARAIAVLLILLLSPAIGAPGSVDPSFSFGRGTGVVRALHLEQNGSIYVGGDFDQIGTAARDGLARITSTGTIDPAFNPPAIG